MSGDLINAIIPKYCQMGYSVLHRLQLVDGYGKGFSNKQIQRRKIEVHMAGILNTMGQQAKNSTL